MISVIIKYEICSGMEAEFQEALDTLKERVKGYDGFLGEEACKNLENEKLYISIFYWRDRESIKSWRNDPEHKRIQQLGRDRILKWYEIQIAEVEREYSWESETNS